MRILALPLIAVLMSGCDSSEEVSDTGQAPRPVKVERVAAFEGAKEYSYPAVVLASEEAEMSFRVPGQIVELPVRAMVDVRKGDLIARLDPRDYKSNVEQLNSQLSAERARLEAMTAGARSEDIAVSRAGVDAAQAEVARASEQAEQILTQYRRGIVAKEQLDSALASLRAAEAQVEARQQELRRGRTGSRREEVEAQEAVIASILTQIENARATESDTELRAPFDGVISIRHVDNFANVQVKEPIVTLQNVTTLELSFDVPGPDVARLGPRSETLLLEAVLDAASGRRFAAEVVEFNSEADEATETFQGRARIERPDDLVILPGMSGRVIVTDGAAPVSGSGLGVPASAVGSAPDGSALVWIVDDENRARERPVQLGEATGDRFAVIAGLEPGETVIVAGLAFLRTGLEVRPMDDTGN